MIAAPFVASVQEGSATARCADVVFVLAAVRIAEHFFQQTKSAFPLPCAPLNAPVLVLPVTVYVALMTNLNRHAAAFTTVGGVLLLASGA